MVESCICVKLYSSVSIVPFLLNQSWKRYSQGFSRAQSKATVQSSHFMVGLGPAQHQTRCSLLVHCVWAPHSPGWVQKHESPRKPGASTKRHEIKREKSFIWEFKYLKSSALTVAMPILTNVLYVVLLIDKYLPYITQTLLGIPIIFAFPLFLPLLINNQVIYNGINDISTSNYYCCKTQ